MRTITVIFTHRKEPFYQIASYKRYKFLCNYDTVSLYDMEEKRNIKVTLEQAIEWYNSGNSTLRTLALSAYTEDELKLNFKYINSKVCNTCFCANVPVDEAEKYNTLVDLAVIAKFFNGSWKKTTGNTGYFIGDLNAKYGGSVVDICNGVGIHQHNTVQYAGIVYFKDWRDVVKAVEILGEELKKYILKKRPTLRGKDYRIEF